MSIILSTLFDALISKVLPTFGTPENALDVLKQAKDDSYDSLVKYTRVEPFCIVDNTLVDQAYTEPMYQVSLNILIAYYLQAVSIINVGHGIPPIKMLRSLSPEGGLLSMESYGRKTPGVPPLFTSAKTTVESANIGLGTVESYRGTRGGRRVINNQGNNQGGNQGGNRNNQGNNQGGGNQGGNQGNNQGGNNQGGNNQGGNQGGNRNNQGNNRNNQGNNAQATVDAEPVKSAPQVKVNEVKKSNIIIGKSLSIDFNSGKNTSPLTVNVRYDIIEVPPPLLVNYIAQGSPDSAFTTRIRQLRAGKLRFWRDFVFASDLLDEQKALMLMDKSNLLKNIVTRRGMGQTNAAMGGGRNYGVSSNCMILNETTLREAERVMKGDIGNERVRTAIFRTLSLLVLIVVDKEYERFTFYFRNKPIPTTVSAKMLKSVGGEKDDSLEALAKALGSNKPVSF